MSSDRFALPRLEDDRTFVLAPGAVLGNTQGQCFHHDWT